MDITTSGTRKALGKYLHKHHPYYQVLDLDQLRHKLGISSVDTPVDEQASTTLGGVVDRISSSKRNAGASLEKVNQVLMSKI